MQLGLIGLPMVGKTTIYELLTEGRGRGSVHHKADTATVRIPDERVDFLAALYKPRKVTYAQLEIVDIPGLAPGSEKSAALFLNQIRESDLLVHVVRAFKNPNIPHVEGSINPLRDIELINYELLVADLDLVEKRIARIKEGKKKNEVELGLLEKLAEALGEGKPISGVELNDGERLLLRNYQFLTTKPVLIVVNVDEEHLSQAEFTRIDEVLEYAKGHGMPLLTMSAKLEAEIAELEGEEKDLFMQEMGLREAGIVRLARTVYGRLGLISFFTVGEDEVKAWTITEGLTAKKAAGKIHSDIERGFIRAEVVEYRDLIELGSMTRVKEKGLFRLEGKDYVIKDGDIVHFRFNV